MVPSMLVYSTVGYTLNRCGIAPYKLEALANDRAHGRRQAWARGGTCPLLEMRKWIFVTVTKCTLEYLNRQ